MSSDPRPPNDVPRAVSFSEALAFWLKLGLISFGGPAGQIALLQQELVERRRWISQQRFLHALNYCMLLPGPEAQQLVTYIGWLLHKRWGGIVAGSLFVLPSLVLLIALSWVYVRFGEVPEVRGLFAGIQCAVTALVLQAAWRIGTRTLRNRWLVGIAVASFLALWAGLAFVWIVVAAALVGAIGARHWPAVFALAPSHGTAPASSSAPTSSTAPPTHALIDDHTPTPAHAQWHALRFVQVVLAGALLWVLPIALMAWLWGAQSPFVDVGLFFTEAALLTFGGAYAVLPFVYQGAVVQFGWLTGAQMMHGLALGETTPGPLIMVVAFVGFVGGYTGQWLGADHALASGVLAACVATWFTFLPSFVFILAGGPWVERTHRQLGWTAPLTAITAAVVGVIAHLALFFTAHLLWPQGPTGPLAWPSLALAALAALALIRWRRGVVEVLGLCAVLGLLGQFGHNRAFFGG